MGDEDLEDLAVRVIRGLAMDGPQAAGNGHPGTAMALAPLAHVLWHRILRYDPADPHWPDRDRFVLSAGHASILLYSLLHLTGQGLTIDDLRAFRQWGSRTPGHPERLHTAGVEVTTGPLGQGFANAVGMGIAEAWLRARFGPEVVDHHTYVICSDGDLSEGISHEAASLAGHLGLGRLVYVYDDNHITIDGPTELSLSDDVVGRFEAYGWHVEQLGEAADDRDALESALRRAAATEDAPSLLVLRSHIGSPSPGRTDTSAAHGEPLGAAEVAETKAILGLPVDETFWVPPEVLELYRSTSPRRRAERAAWDERVAGYRGERELLDACLEGRALPGWEAKLPVWEAGTSVATRKASGAVLEAIADLVPGLVAGGADLTANTGTALGTASVLSKHEPGGRQIHFGIREHAMAASMNGMAAHGGLLPVGGTFFIFSDYMRPAVRLAALSRLHVIHSWTHDSVGLGPDGPTHQPIEQLAAMRATPGLRVIRPADANETAMAWRAAIDAEGPVGLVLSRQDLPVLAGTAGNEGVLRGAYVLADPPDGAVPAVVLIGTGSEVHLCLEAAVALGAEGTPVRVVSMPSWDLFEVQPADYRYSVLPPAVPTLAVEAASSFGWDRYADATVSIDRFGASAPGDVVLAELGFRPDHVAARARRLLTEGS